MSDKLFNEVLDYGIAPQLKSKYLINQYTLFTLIGILLGGYISFTMLRDAFLPPFLDLSKFLFGLLILLPSCYTLFKLITPYKFIFYSNHIIKSNLFGKKRLNHIHGFGWRRREKTNDEPEKDTIAISFGDEYVLLNSLTYSNFYKTKKFLEDNYKEIGDEAFKRYDKRSSNFTSLGLIAAVIAFATLFVTQSEGLIGKMEEDIISFEVTLNEALRIYDDDSNKTKGYILKTVEHPYFNFKIIDESFEARVSDNLKNYLPAGTKISIGINASIYDSKIIKNSSPSFWTKHYDWQTIYVYDLINNERSLIRKEKVRSLQDNHSIEYIWLILALITFIIFTIQSSISSYLYR